mmetsp:Transcript_22641/g.62166  ORF Transcript_22641/g.62166 Transcript_22641/m.62166 type:complete len:281 (-) Transcript_22641:554-1396(-)
MDGEVVKGGGQIVQRRGVLVLRREAEGGRGNGHSQLSREARGEVAHAPRRARHEHAAVNKQHQHGLAVRALRGCGRADNLDVNVGSRDGLDTHVGSDRMLAQHQVAACLAHLVKRRCARHPLRDELEHPSGIPRARTRRGVRRRSSTVRCGRPRRVGSRAARPPNTGPRTARPSAGTAASCEGTGRRRDGRRLRPRSAARRATTGKAAGGCDAVRLGATRRSGRGGVLGRRSPLHPPLPLIGISFKLGDVVRGPASLQPADKLHVFLHNLVLEPLPCYDV